MKITLKELALFILLLLLFTMGKLILGPQYTFISEIYYTLTFIFIITIFYKNEVSLILFFLFFEFLMDPVPTNISISVVMFVLIFGVIIIKSIIVTNKLVVKKKNMAIATILFMVGIILFFHSMIIKDNDIYNVFVAFIPYIIGILVFFLLNNTFHFSKLNMKNVLFSIIVWGCLYSINNLSLFIYNLLTRFNLDYRITLYDPNTLSPVPLLLLSILVLNYNTKRFNIPYNLILLLVWLSITVTYTRSITIASLFLLAFLLIKILRRGSFKTTFNIILLMSVFTFITLRYSLHEPLMDRFENTGDNDLNVLSRLDEYKYAWEIFFNNPFLGNGLGTVFGVSATYIHSYFFYILASLGIVGIVLLLIGVVNLGITYIKSQNLYVKSIILGFVSILIYSLFFAIFKWFSFGIILGIIIFIVLNRPLIEQSKVYSKW